MFEDWSTKKKISVGVLIFFVIIAIVVALAPSEEEETTEPAKFEVSNLSVTPSEISPGETVTVSVNVKNTGGEKGTKEVELTVNGSTKSKSVTLSPEEQTTVSFDISGEETGAYDLSVSGMSDSFEVIEETEPAKFQVSNLTVSPSKVEPGETVSVSVDVKNTGEKAGSYTLELEIDGSVEKTTEVGLDPGESKSSSFTVTREESKSYSVGISDLSGSFEVLKPAEFEVSNLSVSKGKVEPKENVVISIDVRNIGDVKGDHKVELLLNGETVDEKQVTLSPGQSKNVDFSISRNKEGTYKAEIEGLSKTFEVRPKVTVEYEATTKLSSAYLRVTVSGPEKSYNIQLSGPDKQTVGEGYISEDDMADGTESADVPMTEFASDRINPKPGQYTLIVKQSFPEETVFEATPEFEGPEISITDAQFETSYDFSGNIEEIAVTAKNTGGLPVFADEMLVTVEEEESEEPLFDEPLPHGENTKIEISTFITNLDKGVHPVTIELYSRENKLASYDTEVEIG